MIKINKILTVFVFLFAFSATTNAQTSNKNFDGFSIEVGFANQIQSNSVDETTGGGSSKFEHDGQSNSLPRVALNYSSQPFSSFAIGFGGSYLFGESSDNSVPNDHSMKIKNAMSFFVAPTFLVSDTTGVYGKVSFNAAKGEYSEFASNDSQFIMGYGYGFGVKSFVTKNLYLLAEVERVNYGKDTYAYTDVLATDYSFSVDTKTTNATISLGAKF
jgi:hypothetical protein